MFPLIDHDFLFIPLFCPGMISLKSVNNNNATGHGIGLEVHEEPYLVGGNTETLLAENMTFTIEPGIYLVGEMGVRHEDVIRVTADGYEVLGKLMESVENPFPAEERRN